MWRREKLEAQAEEILASLERWKACEQWRREKGRFIPLPLTWLNGERWQAPLEAATGADRIEDEVTARRVRAAEEKAQGTGGLFHGEQAGGVDDALP